MADNSEMLKYYGLLSKAFTNLHDVKQACESYYEILIEPERPGETKAYKCVFRLRQSYLNSRSSRLLENSEITINQFYECHLRETTESYFDFMQLTHVINVWLLDIRKDFSRDRYRIAVLTQADDAQPKTHPDPDSDSESETNFSDDSDCESDDDDDEPSPRPYTKTCPSGHTQVFPTNSKKAKLQICPECLNKLGKKYNFAIYTYNVMALN